MAEYAIGDVQGCFDALRRLLDKIEFNDKQDRLWFAGDLINRGPDSLKTLRFIHALPLKPRIVLGNHDLHLLNYVFGASARINKEDTFQDILHAADRDELCHWLRHQPLLYHDAHLGIVMCHAGIYPLWTLHDAKIHAQYFEQALQSAHFPQILSNLYGNLPDQWTNDLAPAEALRFICNAFTRMRLCDAKGRLRLHYKGKPQDDYPWYETPHRCMIQETIIFGHWAALNGQCSTPNIYALDTGCVWGGQLTALRLHDKQRFAVPGV